MVFRLIAPKWMSGPPKEGEFSIKELLDFNAQGYNVFYLPNGPKNYIPGTNTSGDHIDDWKWVFVDFDLKYGKYPNKDSFLEALVAGIPPTKIVDSGHGIHAYWAVSDLDAKSYLRFQRRLARNLNTEPEVGALCQLMRFPGTINTKDQAKPVKCELIYEDLTVSYTSEQLNKLLPPISSDDEKLCQSHYDKTYNKGQKSKNIVDTLPPKFGQLLRSNSEVQELWTYSSGDRSKNDFRLGHVLFANGFTKEEATSVLVNSAKALQRAPIHRVGYAENIVDKIWTYEDSADKNSPILSPTVKDILSKGEDSLVGEPFRCHKLVDDTHHGFRLGQVMGIVGGSGVGKTTLTLNKFLWFAANNPNYHHFFFSLEQPAGEIAARIKTICGDNTSLFDKIHIISNYREDGSYVNFSIKDVETHLVDFQTSTGKKVGATVVDHIGVLSKSIKNGENDGLIGICNKMKSVAVRVNTFLIMLSQAPREKAGIGDLELNKDAAYGTVAFESYCDYLVCMWQPLKRTYHMGAPTIMAFKFAKIRHKKQHLDRIKEDVCYQLFFNPETERLRELTQDEETSAKYFLSQAVNLRKLDRKTDVITYVSRREGASSEDTIEDDRISTRH